LGQYRNHEQESEQVVVALQLYVVRAVVLSLGLV
jgi:hypothetical protein